MSVIDDGPVLRRARTYADGGLVLDRFNGRPTEVLVEEGDARFLDWLVMGQYESVDVWLRLELDPEDPQFLLTPGPTDLWNFVADHKGARTVLSLDAAGIQVEQAFDNPGGVDAVPMLLTAFAESLASVTDEEAMPGDMEALHSAVEEIRGFLSD